MAATFGIVLDPTAEDTGAELDIADGVGYRIKSIDPPRAPKKTVYVSSFDTEGAEPADEHGYDNAVITIELWVHGTDAADLEAKLAALADKEAKINREKGTMGITSPADTYRIADLVEAEGAETWDSSAVNQHVALVTLRYTRKPFYRGEEVGNLTDDYSADTITSGEWQFDTGVGTIAVSGGQLVPSSTAEKQLYRADREFYNCEATVKVTTTTTVTNLRAGVTLKRLDASNRLRVRIGGDNKLTIEKTDAGVTSALGVPVAHTPSTSTSYWVRGRIEGNKITAEVFTAAPTPSSTPAATYSHTLTSGDATKYGDGIQGNAGLGITPHGTGERYDDFAVLPEVTVEKTLPALVTPPIHGIPGEVSALCRAQVYELSAADQLWAAWGLQFNADVASTAALFYEAESRQRFGGSTVTTTTGASGGGSNNSVTQGTLGGAWQAMLGTNDSSGANPLTNVGEFRVFARVQMPVTNNGAVSMRFDCGIGDFSLPTVGEQVDFAVGHPLEGQWVIVDLGLIDIKRVPSGTHKWEGRLVVKSEGTVSAGDDLIVDWLEIMPIDLYAKLQASLTLPAPTSFAGRDEFDQFPGGALTGKTAPAGGTYVAMTGSDTTDFQVDPGSLGDPRLFRTAVSDTGTIAGSQLVGRAVGLDLNLGVTAAKIDFAWSALAGGVSFPLRSGLIVRAVNASNFLIAYLEDSNPLNMTFNVAKVVGGTLSPIASLLIPRLQIPDGTLTVEVSGTSFFASFGPYSLAGGDLVLATTLATGDAYVYDQQSNSAACTRVYDNLAVWSPTPDAVLFASRQLELGANYVQRQDASGGVGRRIAPRGNHLKLPPARRENRAPRLSLLASRGIPLVLPDLATDARRVQLFITPRYLL